MSEIRTNAGSLANRSQMERKDMARKLREAAGALRENISLEDRARIDAARQRASEVRRGLSDIRSSTKSTLGKVAADLRAARQAWAGIKKKIVFWEAAEREIPGEAGVEEERILAIIRVHPEGIRLVNIGNELGVDWRSLLPRVNSLVNRGIVERIEGTYYPVATVPGEGN